MEAAPENAIRSTHTVTTDRQASSEKCYNNFSFLKVGEEEELTLMDVMD